MVGGLGHIWVGADACTVIIVDLVRTSFAACDLAQAKSENGA